jgi:hypothetical protein
VEREKERGVFVCQNGPVLRLNEAGVLIPYTHVVDVVYL